MATVQEYIEPGDSLAIWHNAHLVSKFQLVHPSMKQSVCPTADVGKPPLAAIYIAASRLDRSLATSACPPHSTKGQQEIYMPLPSIKKGRE